MANNLRPVRHLASFAAASLFAACASHDAMRPTSAGAGSDAGPFLPTTPADTAHVRPLQPRRQGADDQALLHPPVKAEIGVVVGKQSLELNLGGGASGGGTSAVLGRLDLEYFLANQFGFYFTGDVNSGGEVFEDIDAFEDSDYSSNDISLGVAYRATIDDDFRMPIRVGLFRHSSEWETGNFIGDVGNGPETLNFEQETESIGLRLGIEPELILMQNPEAGNRSELSLFADLSSGAGPADFDLTATNVTQATTATNSDESYAFNLSWEFGVRFSWRVMAASLSGYGKKVNYGSPDQGLGFATDEDFTGVGINLGVRF
jgi:hypothetical protein